MVSIKRKILLLFVRFRIFPNVFFILSAHKIFEFRQVQNGVTFQKNDVILDVGCGRGYQTLLIGKKCKKVVGIDISKQAINFASFISEKCANFIESEFLCSTLESANFPDNYFDKVFSICVIEHIANYKEVLAEIYRVLKPGGVFAFSVDALTVRALIQKHKKDHHDGKYFSVQEVHNLLKAAGFKDISAYPILKSDYAVKIFTRGIKDDFAPRFTFIADYVHLLYSERNTKNKDGLFICAKCVK